MASRKSYILAAAVAFGVAAWMLSDNIFGTNPPTKVEVSTDPSPANTQQFIVSAVLVKNEPIVKVVRANGFSEADFIVTVLVQLGKLRDPCTGLSALSRIYRRTIILATSETAGAVGWTR